MIKRFLPLLVLLLCSLSCRAAERALALTDKELYLTGERLHISVCILDDEQQQPSTLSRVAYVEISDTYRLCAQGLVALTDGRGWADIPLPASLHSGNYLLTVYTRAMRNLDLSQGDALFAKVISIVNPARLSRADDVVFLPADSIAPHPAAPQPAPLSARAGQTVTLPDDTDGELLLASLSVTCGDLLTPDYSALRPERRMLTQRPAAPLLPEVEGHLVQARPAEATAIVAQTRLVMVGKQNAVFDGQWQPDGTWLYYTTGLYGRRPAMLSTYDAEGQPVAMQFVSPFARILPLDLPKLEVGCSEADLQRRALGAQHEQDITDWLAGDSLLFSADLLSGEPRFSYDLDEYTKFKSVREILIEFVRGVKRDRVHGVNQLFTIDPVMREYSRWSALVLLDGMPVFDIDDILDYDARLLKYVMIYPERYTFGSTIYGGIISFVSQKGLLSNFNLDRTSHLVAYSFPQDRPAFIRPSAPEAGTVVWCPQAVNEAGAGTPRPVAFTAPAVAGTYRVLLQGFDKRGNYVAHEYLLQIEAN